MLFGWDQYTRRSYQHRQVWLQHRLMFLASVMAIDIEGFCTLANHLRLILHNRPDVAAEWSAEEVAQKWLQLCPPLHPRDPRGSRDYFAEETRGQPVFGVHAKSVFIEGWSFNCVSGIGPARRPETAPGLTTLAGGTAGRLGPTVDRLAQAISNDTGPQPCGPAVCPSVRANGRFTTWRQRLVNPTGRRSPRPRNRPGPTGRSFPQPGPAGRLSSTQPRRPAQRANPSSRRPGKSAMSPSGRTQDMTVPKRLSAHNERSVRQARK